MAGKQPCRHAIGEPCDAEIELKEGLHRREPASYSLMPSRPQQALLSCWHIHGGASRSAGTQAAFCGIQLTEGGIEAIKGMIRQFPDPPQRMTGRDPILDQHVGEQRAAALPLTSHLSWAVAPFSQGGRVFQQILKALRHGAGRGGGADAAELGAAGKPGAHPREEVQHRAPPRRRAPGGRQVSRLPRRHRQDRRGDGQDQGNAPGPDDPLPQAVGRERPDPLPRPGVAQGFLEDSGESRRGFLSHRGPATAPGAKPRSPPII